MYLYNKRQKAKYYKSNKDQIKDRHLRELYKIGLEAYNALFESQNGRCAICERTSNRCLDVDHDHTTGKIRGLLCSPCNRALGMFQESIPRLFKATQYLKEYIDLGIEQ